MHEFLCYRIAQFVSMRAGGHDSTPDWRDTTWIMFYNVKLEMPELSGGVSKLVWDEYVYCVLHALLIWEAYCTRVQILARPEVADDDVFRLA